MRTALDETLRSEIVHQAPPLPDGWKRVTKDGYCMVVRSDGKPVASGSREQAEIRSWFVRYDAVASTLCRVYWESSPEVFNVWRQALAAAPVTAMLPGEDLPEVDVDAIELIHRHQDGWITFCRQVNDNMENLGGVRANRLREYLPKLLPFLMIDAYFSLNASYRAYRTRNDETGLLHGDRREISLRYLNACYVDLDTYKGSPPLEWPMNLAAVLDAAERDVIPPPSIIVRSGRGLYLIWLLANERTGALQTAKPWERAMYSQVNRALAERLNGYNPSLYADSIHDAARVLRVFGSINSKSREPVLAQVQVTARGMAPSYALDEMAELVGVPRILPRDHYRIPAGREIRNRGSAPNRRRGPEALARHRADDVLAIAQDVGGFPHGMRGRALAYLAEFMRWGGWTLSETTATVAQVAAGCRPAYPHEANDVAPERIALDAFKATSRRRHQSARLAAWFKVTDEQAERLGLTSIIPERTRDKRRLAPSPREQAQEERRALIRKMIEERPGDYPSLRVMQRRLAEQGVKASVETIRKDVAAILAGGV